MSVINDNLNEIRKAFDFLEQKDFTFRIIDDYEICYINKDLNISIKNERYSDDLSATISFDENLSNRSDYSLGWIQRVELNDNPFKNKSQLEKIKIQAEFLKNNLDQVCDEQYCKKMEQEYNKIILAQF